MWERLQEGRFLSISEVDESLSQRVTSCQLFLGPSVFRNRCRLYCTTELGSDWRFRKDPSLNRFTSHVVTLSRSSLLKKLSGLRPAFFPARWQRQLYPHVALQTSGSLLTPIGALSLRCYAKPNLASANSPQCMSTFLDPLWLGVRRSKERSNQGSKLIRALISLILRLTTGHRFYHDPTRTSSELKH